MSQVRRKSLVLDRIDVGILRALLRAQWPLRHVEIREHLQPNARYNRETIGAHVAILLSEGLVERPHGPRGGVAITDAGRRRLIALPI